MNAQQILQRCVGLRAVLDRAKTPDEGETILAEMRRLHDRQCLACYHSDDDPIHQPRKGWLRAKPPFCPYTPRVPERLQTPPLDLAAYDQGGDA